MRKNTLAAMTLAAAFAGFNAPSAGTFGTAIEPRRSAFRKGRRFNSKGGRIAPRKGNPAGTKLARKAERGQLGLIVSR